MPLNRLVRLRPSPASQPFASPAYRFSEAEAKPNRGIDRVAIEEAVRQSVIDL